MVDDTTSRRLVAPWVRRTGLLLLGAVAVASGAALGMWYLPFVAGVVAGCVRLRGRAGRLRALAVLIVLGPVAWAAVLAVLASTGARIAGTGATVAALAGLPARAEITIGLTLLVALLQTAVGAWLGRAIADLPAARRRRPAATGEKETTPGENRSDTTRKVGAHDGCHPGHGPDHAETGAGERVAGRVPGSAGG